MAKRTYTTLEPLRHDGEDIPVGGKVAIDEAAAEALIRAGVIVDPKAKAEAEAAAKAKIEAEAAAQ